MKPLREKCSYADKYQATRQPTCGCLTCWLKWLKRRTAKWRETGRVS